MIVNKSMVKPYLDGDADLIPLHVWNKVVTRKGKQQERGKTPLMGDWTKLPKNVKQALEKAKDGYNLGVRLNETDIVVDVDPRNGGEESLGKLYEYLDMDLSELYPTVNTGGGGYHFYMLKPKDWHICETLEAYPGIEFKTKGRQVVAAGSKHPSGNYYEWDEFCEVHYSDRARAPKKLLKLIQRDIPENQSTGGELTPGQLERLLEQLPVESFGDDGLWFPIMCASHHGTNGQGIEEFVEWSLGDPEYADSEPEIRTRWDSLGGKALNFTVNTLYKAVLSYGGTTSVVTANEEFEDFASESEDDIDLEDVIGVKETRESMVKGVAIDLANQLHKASDEADIVKAIRASLQADLIERARAEKVICANTGINKTTLNGIVSSIKEDIIEDLGRVLAAKTIELKYYKGKGIIHNGQFWAFNGKFWKPVTNESVGNKCLRTLDKIRKQIDIKVKDNTIKAEAVSLIASMVSKDEDVLGLRDEPKPVINCQNGELWIDDKGDVSLHKHNPKSHLLQVLDVDYTPGAECPIFDKSIRKTFSNFPDTEDLVRHFEEYMGYCLHPVKHKPYWWLFKGPGGDGKSTLMEILSALLGEAVLPDSIEKFKTGSSGDNHAMANLVGKLLVYDDDMNSNMLLPDGAIKNISSRGDLTANPKGRDAFKFRKACTVTMLSNGFPRTRAVDRGFRRRAMVVPFNMAFHEQEGIYDLAETIKNKELAGVLNRALQGLKRLRERGDFLIPNSCELAVNEWLNEANNVVHFFNHCVERTNSNTDRISVTDMYVQYNSFCHEYGINKVETKSNMTNTLKDIEIWYGDIGSNRRGFRNVKFKGGLVEDFNDTVEDEEDW